jgi:DNA repair exonuclease SbcCD ATPase subunit
MPRIRRLDLRGFRGVRKDVALLFDGKSILLFGENGTGKSSFVDALEKLFTGRVSTLDGRAQGLSSDRHGPHIRNVGSPPRIAVTFDDPASSTFAQDSAPASLPPEIQKYVESARENLYILRRRQVLEFIDCQPRERYDLLRPILPLSGIEAMENALRAARERVEGETQRSGQEVARLVTDLRRELRGQDLGQEPTQVEVISAINQILKDVGQSRIDDLGDLEGAIGRLDAELARFGDLTRQSRLSNAEKALEELIESISSLTIGQLVTAVEALREREAGSRKTRSARRSGSVRLKRDGCSTRQSCSKESAGSRRKAEKRAHSVNSRSTQATSSHTREDNWRQCNKSSI